MEINFDQEFDLNNCYWMTIHEIILFCVNLGLNVTNSSYVGN